MTASFTCGGPSAAFHSLFLPASDDRACRRVCQGVKHHQSPSAIRQQCILHCAETWVLWAAQVIQDLYEECGKYGQLVSVIVPRPPNPASAMELFGSNNYGKVGYPLHIQCCACFTL
jgi:hypothetical protein